MSNEILRKSLLADAAAIREKFKATGNPRERMALKAQYEKLDKQLDGLKPEPPQPEAKEEEYVSSRHGDTRATWIIRQEEERAGKGPSKKSQEREKELEEIEKGRRHLLEKQRAGAGDPTFRRIKNELDYLLNNYVSTNDTKIETLIDRWRRSGDPSYDPSIKQKFKNVRKKKVSNDHPI